MKIENQVCTFEQAKKLKELGVLQNSLFYHWTADNLPVPYNIINQNYLSFGKTAPCGFWDDKLSKISGQSFYSAFTVAELGEMFGIGSNATEWLRNKYINNGTITSIFRPDFMAEKLIEAIEIEVITVEEINARLKHA